MAIFAHISAYQGAVPGPGVGEQCVVAICKRGGQHHLWLSSCKPRSGLHMIYIHFEVVAEA